MQTLISGWYNWGRTSDFTIERKEYSEHGLPWFNYFDGDREAIDGAKKLGKVKSVKELAEAKGGNYWFEQYEYVDTQVVKKIVSNGFQKSKKRKVEDRESW